MITFKIGILGTGNIAEKIADTLVKLEGFEPYAIASRDIKKAEEFGDKFDIKKRYGSYEELTKDPDVELIYIATPHSHHAEHAKICINAGKPVLVEKAFSYNLETAEEVINLAKAKNVFVGEAMWTRYMPMMRLVCDLIQKNKIIGDVRHISATLGYNLFKVDRITNPALAGGALLDLGVYPINLALMILGQEPVSVVSSCLKLQTGVDGIDMIQLNFQGGRTASLLTSITYKADNNATIYGTIGYMEIDNINNPEEIRVYNNNGELSHKFNPKDKQISGYEYEFLSSRKAIIVGNLEPPEMTHEDTLKVMKLCDRLRKTWKVTYPMESDAE